jgi:DNA-binding transcriptional MerR regulator
MTLAELADTCGLSARTVRFYIARGLLAGPVKAGRDAEYTSDHVQRLERIKALQADGMTLAEIQGKLQDSRSTVPAAPWWQHVVAEDVMVWVRADAPPWRVRQLRSALEEFAARMSKQEQAEEETR